MRQMFGSVQFSSVAQSCPTLCNPINCSTPGLPVHHQLLDFTQTHVHRVSDAIQQSHPLRPLLLLPPIPPSIRVFSNESALRMRWPKYWSFSFSIIPSKEIPGLISLQSKGLSRVFSNTIVQKHQFFSAQPSSQSNSHIHTCSVQFSRSVMSDSLLPHEPQHARPPCLSPTPGVHSDSRPLSQ